MPGISIYNKCNNNCLMCSNPDHFWQSKRGFSQSYLLKKIDRFYHGENVFLDNYRDSFSISGGEITLSPCLISIIKKIDSLFSGKKIICLTNGRIFSYENYARDFMQLSGNLEIAVAIHGHNSRIHDAVSRVRGSFLQAKDGLKNIYRFKKINQVIEIRVIIHRLNYKLLDKITDFIKNEFPWVDRVVYIFFEIEGQAEKNISLLKLTYQELAPYLNKIYKFIRFFKDIRFYHFPLCTLPPKFFPYIWRTLPSYEVSFLKSCNYCKMRELCLGIHKGYSKYMGASEFQPVINSSINLTRSKHWHHPIISVNNS